MPSGLLILIIGAVIGVAVGWLILGEPIVGGGAGFIFAFVYLLIASWLDRREDQAPG